MKCFIRDVGLQLNDVGYLHRCVVFLYMKMFAENTNVKYTF